MTDVQKQLVLELRLRGCKFADIAVQTGLSANTIKSYCQRHGQTLNALKRKEICKQCYARLSQKAKQKPKTFCSDRCRYAWWAAHRDLLRRRAIYRQTCGNCGRDFTAYGNNHRKFCSRGCYRASFCTNSIAQPDAENKTEY
jgi:endogenous inhibitor of DNA gyrase (YacG/DUF329 family)